MEDTLSWDVGYPCPGWGRGGSGMESIPVLGGVKGRGEWSRGEGGYAHLPATCPPIGS